MIKFEENNYCEYCGTILNYNDDITVREGKVYHTECLPENLIDETENEKN